MTTPATMTTLFQAALRVSAPLLAVQTADQEAAVEELKAAATDVGITTIVQWDAVRGITGLNDAGTEWANTKIPNGLNTITLADALMAALALPKRSTLFVRGAHRWLQSTDPAQPAQVIQAIANLRNPLKANFRSVVFLGPGITMPIELSQDVVVLKHRLPNPAELAEVVRTVHAVVNLPAPADIVTKAVEALSGLSKFGAETQTAMSLTTEGLDLSALWERKRVAIEQARGLKVYRGTEKFADIVGLESVKASLAQRLTGRKPLGVVVLIDEVDKVLANVEHDTSGVRMDQLRTLLAEMEDNEWEGVMLAGLPGGGKSLIGKALGNEAGALTIEMDLGGMEASLLGDSEQHVRHAMDVVKAVGAGHAFFIMTSNNATLMRPELQRRLTSGWFFFDLMTEAERDAAWRYYSVKYEIPATDPRPDDSGWTAAEIRNCARQAWNCRVPLREAARFIVPIARARGNDFDAMRRFANGRYLDASQPGPYHYTAEPMAAQLRGIELPKSEGPMVLDTTGLKNIN